MDEAGAKEQERISAGGAYIWFHYKTQFAAQGRLHVIQVEVPVPVDASAEERERLLQEALAGLDQFSARLEQRLGPTAAPRKTPVASSGEEGGGGRSAPAHPAGEEGGRAPSARPTGLREPPAEMRPAAPARPASAPATSTEGQLPPSASQLRRRMAPALPSTPGVFGNLNSDLTLPQFLQILRDNFGIDSKQAMKLLGVRSLSNINLREALDQLRYLLAQRNATANRATSRAASESASSSAGSPSASLSLSEQAYPAVFSQREWSQGRTREELIIGDRGPKDEEEEEEEEQEAGQGIEPSLPSQLQQSEGDDDYQEEQEYIFEEDDGENDRDDWSQEHGEEGGGGRGGYDREEERGGGEGEELNLESRGSRQLSLQDRIHARTLLNKMREVRGNTPASQARLTVLWNVIGEQISEDELRELIGRIWGVAALKQLSIDQVEALISWAKQDNFDRDVAVILALN
ncbi:hypothetical protein [Thermogemmatispora onikobensis]|uniref:hypothetical protein n=1 Tax=Thermogemmatispora onikobensis TaxID=732234 RepID=UPI000853C4E2|nr:hypothetical protein [Thermogemmatispora onikobensis]